MNIKIRINKKQPFTKDSFQTIWDAVTDKQSIIFHFVDDKDKADFLVEQTEAWSKIGAIAGGVSGAILGVVTVIQTGDIGAAYKAFQTCLSLGASLGYGVGFIIGLILWKWGADSLREPLFEWFGLRPNRVRVSPA